MSAPPEPAPPLRPGPRLALLLSLSAGVGQMLGLVLLLGLGVPLGPGLIGMSALLGYGAMFVLLAPRLGESPAAALGLVPPPRGHRLAILLLLPAVVLVSEIDNWAAGLFPLPEGTTDAPEGSSPRSWAYQLALVQIVVLPMVHELFFRGLLQPWLVASLGARRGVAAMAALDALASSLAILNPRLFAPTAASAALLGFVRQTTGSLVPCLTLHALIGTVTLGAHFRVFGIAGFDDTSQAHTPFLWLLGAGALTVAGIARCRKLQPAVPAASETQPPES